MTNTVFLSEICSNEYLSDLYKNIDQGIIPDIENLKQDLMNALDDGQLDLTLHLLCLFPELSEKIDWKRMYSTCEIWSTFKFIFTKIEKKGFVNADNIALDEDIFYLKTNTGKISEVFILINSGIFAEPKNIPVHVLNEIMIFLRPNFRDMYKKYIHPEMFIKECEPRNVEYTKEFLFYYNFALSQVDEAIKIVKTGCFKTECNIHPKIVENILKHDIECTQYFKPSCLPIGCNSGKNTKKAHE